MKFNMAELEIIRDSLISRQMEALTKQMDIREIEHNKEAVQYWKKEFDKAFKLQVKINQYILNNS